MQICKHFLISNCPHNFATFETATRLLQTSLLFNEILGGIPTYGAYLTSTLATNQFVVSKKKIKTWLPRTLEVKFPKVNLSNMCISNTDIITMRENNGVKMYESCNIGAIFSNKN